MTEEEKEGLLFFQFTPRNYFSNIISTHEKKFKAVKRCQEL